MKAPRTITTLPAIYRGREQTFIKHLIREQYLERVAWNILPTQRDFVFVDGFSGPWASNSGSCEDTSFSIAIRILRRVRDQLKDTYGRDSRVRCIFVEKRATAFDRLAQAVEAARDIEVQPIRGRFEDQVDAIRVAVGGAFALISIDPKGWSFDLRRLAPLLRHRPSEVIVNFMFEHVNRFLDDKRAKIHASYGLPFGDHDWRMRFDALQASGLGREGAVLELFRTQLKTIGHFDYVLSTPIQRPTVDRSQFYLVYGTRNRKGLVEFRNVQRKGMEAEEFSRIEAKHEKRASKSRQGILPVYAPRSPFDLRQPEIEKARGWLGERFASSSACPYAEVLVDVLERFSVTETELKDLLVAMQRQGQIVFDGMEPRQRKPSGGVTILPARTT